MSVHVPNDQAMIIALYDYHYVVPYYRSTLYVPAARIVVRARARERARVYVSTVRNKTRCA